jgi:hypothetical protein
LREAVRAVNLHTSDACPAGTGSDTIVLPAGTFTLHLAMHPGRTNTITLIGYGNRRSSAEVSISDQP